MSDLDLELLHDISYIGFRGKSVNDRSSEDSKVSDYLYRYEDELSATFDPDGDFSYSTTNIRLYKYKIISRTPKGAWIDIGIRKRFVRLTARKKYACNTEIEALDQLIHRKDRYITILHKKLSRAEQVKEFAEAKKARLESLQRKTDAK